MLLESNPRYNGVTILYEQRLMSNTHSVQDLDPAMADHPTLRSTNLPYMT